MVGRSIVAVSFLGLTFFSVSVYGFSSSSKTTKPRCNGSKYYSYKTFKRLGVPAILYSTVAKVATKVMRVKPQQVVAFNASVSSTTKIALITGSNTGVGFETAKALAVDHGYEVIIACRSAEKGAKACAAINAAVVPNATSNMGKAVFVQPLDLSNLDSVRDFGRAVHEKCKSIDVLVNNAGKNSASAATQQFNDDQTLDDLFTTNFLGHFLLTNILLDKCSRIVNLSSVMHHFPIYAKDDVYQDVDSIDFWKQAALEPAHDRDDVVRKPYAASKLAALLFSIELNRRYGQTTNGDNSNTLRSIAVNPGSVNSDIWRNYPSAMKAIFRQIYLTPEQGSTTSIAASVMEFDDKDVVYLQPYWLPRRRRKAGKNVVRSCPFPMLEMLGPYVGYQPTEPRLPEDGGRRASASLFAVCEELTGCNYPATLVGTPRAS